jgi:competence protein ComEA
MPSLPVTRTQALAIALVLVVLLVAGGRLLGRRGSAAAEPTHTFAVASTAAAPATRVVVDVVGAVRRPGLYRLASGSRVADAIARAGGATAKADLEQVNLAAPIGDGTQIVVPRRGRVAAAGGAASGPAHGGPVQLSTATVEQLDALPGIGPVTAQKIVDYRTQHGAFHSVEELDAIPGIGPRRIDQLRGLVVP